MGGTHLLQAGYYRSLSAWRGCFLFWKVFHLKRIISGVLLDILPHASGFLYAEMSFDKTGNEKVSFFSYEQDRQDILPITTRVYLTHKFGDSYREIMDEVGDFLSCDAAPLGKNGTVVLFESGEMYIFASQGKLVWKGQVTYQEDPVRDLAVDGKDIWCAVPDGNAVICYSPAEKRVSLRIGGKESSAFEEPVSVSKFGDTLYVTSRRVQKVRSIHLPDYDVQDYRKFREPVHKFFRVEDREYVVLDSGVYVL